MMILVVDFERRFFRFLDFGEKVVFWKFKVVEKSVFFGPRLSNTTPYIHGPNFDVIATKYNREGTA